MTATVLHQYGGSVLDIGIDSNGVVVNNVRMGIFTAKTGGTNLTSDASITNPDGTTLSAPVAIEGGVMTTFGDTVERDLYLVALDSGGSELGARVLAVPSNVRSAMATTLVTQVDNHDGTATITVGPLS